MIPGLMIGVAEVISLEGIAILVVEVSLVLAGVSKLPAETAEVDNKAGRTSGSSDDWELAQAEYVGMDHVTIVLREHHAAVWFLQFSVTIAIQGIEVVDT
uniref:Uncharacterized protein n=1 Tax=Romanomermis culicivorax TaxID=13658 RepID=A0A915L8L5_ROMCU